MTGEVTERPKVPDSESGVVHATEVRIPPSPPGSFDGEVTERPKVRLEFVCIARYRGFESLLSAISSRGSIWSPRDGLCNGEAANSARSEGSNGSRRFMCGRP